MCSSLSVHVALHVQGFDVDAAQEDGCTEVVAAHVKGRLDGASTLQQQHNGLKTEEISVIMIMHMLPSPASVMTCWNCTPSAGPKA